VCAFACVCVCVCVCVCIISTCSCMFAVQGFSQEPLISNPESCMRVYVYLRVCVFACVCCVCVHVRPRVQQKASRQ